ncbi:hypothetical protein ACT4WM_18765 (plasmid) [Acinetobacter baumannii]|jgi:hypothetical protein|uniref:hypothetical protein n=1 Tax=Acinetobacter TaxID=469 RepID=UPI001D99E6FC|nr:hypothetical protein [Acinetobacter baumannii]EHU1360674.1 hypothetical protein [Acinetobacter baumannii]MCW1520929.1 hypothetical protein [Acinetobacter baumannii]HEO1814481.1 hypothetical protein [Acinetobacter baumannii]
MDNTEGNKILSNGEEETKESYKDIEQELMRVIEDIKSKNKKNRKTKTQYPNLDSTICS